MASLLIDFTGIARDQSTGFSKNGQPDMSDAQAISDHFMKSEMQSWLDTYQTNVAGGMYNQASNYLSCKTPQD